MYFICHVIQQGYSVEMLCVFMGESSSQHVTTLKSLVILTIGILIVNPIRDGFFGAAHGWGAKKALHSLKSVTHILQC